MIVLVTPAERNGGILQFSMQMLHSFVNLGINTLLFVPENLDIKYYADCQDHIRTYKKTKSVFAKHHDTRSLVERILLETPQTVLCLEDSVLMWQLLYNLWGTSVRTCIVIHDIVRHPYRNITFRKIAVEWLRIYWSKKTIKLVNHIILLSKNSCRIFKEKYPNNQEKIVLFNLGAHIPETSPEVPLEMLAGIQDYFLFFGRIDKYKGIMLLIQAYKRAYRGRKIPLVIAGNGRLTKSERTELLKDKNIILINRFITDGEMIWLFQNAYATVLPYIEASQSGVLPISYHYKVPVICTDIEGLTEFVEPFITGLIGATVDEIAKAMDLMTDNAVYSPMITHVQAYHFNHFSWPDNCRLLLEKINV